GLALAAGDGAQAFGDLGLVTAGLLDRERRQESRIIGCGDEDGVRIAADFLEGRIEGLQGLRLFADRRGRKERCEVLGTKLVDRSLRLHAVAADEVLEEAV